MTDEELREGIAKHKWWHQIELAPGVITPGKSQNRFLAEIMHLPDDLSGMEILDIGCWDGFFSFLCENRNAKRVVACDIWETTGREAFDFAREALFSDAEPLHGSFLDLDPDLGGRFDLVLFLGVLYHLKDPLGGLEKVASLTRPGGRVIIDTVVDTKALFDRPVMAFYPSAELNNDPTNWWVPNLPALTSMMAVSGFSKIESVVQLYGGDRTIIHGTKMNDRDYAILREQQDRNPGV
jgi:tRNA (mo5U34)-methyltransferase